MTNLLEFKEWLRNFYGKFSIYINAGIKFFTMFIVTLLINNSIGYNTKINNLITVLLLSMVSAFLPTNVMIVFAGVIILLHLYTVSLELAAIVLVFFLIVYLIYFRFSPKYAYALLLTPVAFALKVPFLVPLILGMTATPAAMVPMCFGGVIYFLLQNISTSSISLFRTEDETATQAYLYIVENTIKSSQMYLTIITIMLTVLIVYFIKKTSIDRSWSIAIVVGTIVDIFVFLIGDFVLDISKNVLEIVIGAIISMLLAIVVQFFLFSVDYSRTEYVQFEDDEYYYYVKAVPKVSIAKRSKEVKRINPQKKVREDKRKNTSTVKTVTKKPMV